MLLVYFLSCEREKKTERKGERSLTYMHVLCVGGKKRGKQIVHTIVHRKKKKEAGCKRKMEGMYKNLFLNVCGRGFKEEKEKIPSDTHKKERIK